MMAQDEPIHNFGRKFICVQYPGIVVNEHKAINTLGGLNHISQIHSKKKRLELRFRPEDPFCKPAFANKYAISGLVLKIKIKKSVGESQEAKKIEILSTEVLGVVNTIYKFETLSDFQYLPLASKEAQNNGLVQLKYILNDIKPVGILGVEWFNTAQHYHLVPPLFSRVDTPQNYAFRSNMRANESDESKLIAETGIRKKRLSHAVYLTFNNTDSIPMTPQKNALDLMKFVKKEQYDLVKKLFEEKPIWSKVALMCITNLTSNQMKFILPSLAYYYTSGPWRVLWIRFGYDPRKVPQSRIYQNIDFRVRSAGGLRDIVKIRPGSVPVMNQSQMHKNILDSTFSTDIQPNELNESFYIFRPGMIPPRRQIFFQFCDLRVPEIEEMISKLGEVLPGTLCHERRGWMPAGFDEQCRQIMYNYALDTLREANIGKSSYQKMLSNNNSLENNEGFNLEIEDVQMDIIDEMAEGSLSEFDDADDDQEKPNFEQIEQDVEVTFDDMEL